MAHSPQRWNMLCDNVAQWRIVGADCMEGSSAVQRLVAPTLLFSDVLAIFSVASSVVTQTLAPITWICGKNVLVLCLCKVSGRGVTLLRSVQFHKAVNKWSLHQLYGLPISLVEKSLRASSFLCDR